jgi:hypothetical protein
VSASTFGPDFHQQFLLLGKMVFGSILPRPAGLPVSAHARLRIYGGSFAMVI